MQKTSTRLSDGRELIYYDEHDVERSSTDPRQLPERATAAELRYDALLDEWVAIASHRQTRTFLPPTNECPLCPSRNGRHTEIPAEDYDVVVFENRFSSLLPEAPPVAPLVDPGSDLFLRQPAIGRCEVVCFTSDHDSAFSQLSPERARTVVDAWADRTTELSAMPGVEQVFPFENRGREIGVTLSHPHGQIYAYPFVTPRTRRMLESARAYRERTWRNLFADVLATEHKAETRVVARTEYWTAFVPAAARWPMEVHLYPHRQVPDLPGLRGEERDDLARLYLDILRRLDSLYDDPMPYIAAWHQAPVRVDHELAYLHLEVFSIRRAAGKLKYLAGSESGMGAFINDVPPELAAQMLRDARSS
jgi:UDPglucose--hexose-1-phosphate uridylyltransferase